MSGKNKTKHNTRKTLLKGKSKKDLKELVVPLVKTPPTGGVVPPFTVFLHMRRNVMIVSVPLPRVPDKIVNYDASAERFLLDTTKFTRKPFYLEFTYPKGIKIEAGGEAKIENGIFSATLSLLSVPESFQLKPDGMDVSATNESRKRKRSGEAAQPQQPKTAESPAKKTTAKAKASENGETAAVAPKTKQPKKKQKKAASGESSEKQIDARAVSLDKAMGLIDELGAKEESQISEKLHKEKEKKAALNAKQREKRQKKQQKKDKIEQLVDELKKEKKEQEEEKKPLKKATPRKVSFGEPGKKAAKAGGATTSPKAAKKPALKKTATKKN